MVLPRSHSSGQQAHIEGLNALIDYFKGTKDFEYFLLLDSDCFPICSWTDKLINIIGKYGYNVAAPVRYENLDTFAHPCAFFFNRSALKSLRFGMNFFDGYLEKYREVSSNITEFFPLIRTNKLNYHPVLFGIYWNIFYHHGAGSRDLRFRSTDIKYHHQTCKVEAMEENVFRQLELNAKNIIDKFNGDFRQRIL